MRDTLSKVKTRMDRLADQVPEQLTREQIRKMTDAELDARLTHYARRGGFNTAEELIEAVRRDPVLGPATAARS